jgi:uncharacterized membrane protein
MALLIVAALVWLGIHFGIAGTRLRDTLVSRIGEGWFRGLFSVASIAALVLLIMAWRRAPTEPLWHAPDWLRWLLVVAMLPAFLLFVASVSTPNPTMVGPQGTRQGTMTRPPMLWSFAIWAGVHIIGTGDTAALVFGGTFLVTALGGMPSIDGKLARRDPATWQALSAATSIAPFAAIAQRRNRLVLREIGWRTPLIAVIAWALVLYIHPWLFGVAPVAM